MSLSRVAVAHPPLRVSQAEAAARLGAVTGETRRVAALARGSTIEQRAVALPPDDIAALGDIAGRNDVYKQQAPPLALQAATRVLGEGVALEDCSLVTSSCTGYMVPGWDAQLVEQLCLPLTTQRLPLTEAGCSGGVLALAVAAGRLRTRAAATALTVSVEICSLAFHNDVEPGNLTSALIFGDGAGAALLEATDAEAGLQVVDSLSYLVPCSRDALGFDLTNRGFYPLLIRELAELLPAPSRTAAELLLGRHGLGLQDLSFCLAHPGGPRILDAIECVYGLPLPWSRQSLREFGNTSSAAIYDVIRRYMEDDSAPDGWGLVIGFGPGVSIETLLVHRC